MMKTTKKVISVILSLVMIMSMFAGLEISSFAEDDVLSYLTYEINNGEVTITGCDTSISGDIVIPSEIQGYPVTKIGTDAFYDCENLEYVNIPDTVTEFGDYVFQNCHKINNISIPYGITEITSGMFARCYALESIEIPSTVETIGDIAFMACNSLTEVSVPWSVNAIGSGAFQECTSLTSVTIEYGAETIESSAFYDCPGVEEVIIPDSVTSIGQYAFGYIKNSYSVDPMDGFVIKGFADSAAETYANENGFEFVLVDSGAGDEDGGYDDPSEDWFEYGDFFYLIIDGEAVIKAYNTESETADVVIPATIEGYPVTSIGEYAFMCAENIEHVTIPSTVTKICNGAFDGCINMKTVEIPDSVGTIGSEAFFDCTSLEEVVIPDSVVYVGGWAFAVCSSLEKVILPSFLTAIQEGTFFDCQSLSDIDIPGSVEQIGEMAFENCISLKNIKIPGSVTEIRENALGYGNNGESLTLIDGFTITGYTGSAAETYANENGIEFIALSVEEPTDPSLFMYEINNGEVTITGINGFLGNNVVISATIEGYPVTAIGEMAFAECADIISLSIPDSVKTIGSYAFYYCAFLESVKLPAGLTVLNEGVFNTCLKLTTVKIPESVTTIGSGAFNTCTSLAQVNIPGKVTTIEDYAFYKTGSLKTLTIGGSVETIGNYAFTYSGIESVIIPDGVTTIGEHAFESCDNLSSVTIAESVTSIGEMAFGYNEDWELVDGFVINGYAGSAAETYANENGIKFVALGNKEPVESDKLVTDDENIVIDDDKKLSAFEPGRTAKDLTESISNSNFVIKDKDGNAVAEDALVGTGSKIQILDNDGNVVSEYDVVVPADVDGNGEITASDARKALRGSAGMDEIDGVYKLAADSDGNDELTASDARKILRKSAGLE